MTDLPAQIKIVRLQRQMELISSVINNIPSALTGIGRIGSYLELRQANNLTIAQDTIIVKEDYNGNAGVFSVDPVDVNTDDGVNVIIDQAARHWVRWGSII